MADSKLLKITKEFQARLQAVTTTAPFKTGFGASVYRQQIPLHNSELPAAVVLYMGSEPNQEVPKAQTVKGKIAIIAYAAIGTSEPEDVAADLLSDIALAIEKESKVLKIGNDAALLLFPGLAFEKDEILYNDSTEDFIGVRVEYSIPMVRAYGVV